VLTDDWCLVYAPAEGLAGRNYFIAPPIRRRPGTSRAESSGGGGNFLRCCLLAE